MKVWRCPCRCKTRHTLRRSGERNGKRRRACRWQRALRGADSERILSDLIQIEDFVAARHFYAAIQDQQPAAEARTA